MGVAIADAAADMGADVELVIGPVSIYPSNKSVNVINVVTTEEMAQECISRMPSCHIAILSAAVADFGPEELSNSKIKKSANELVLRLKRTTDIGASLGKLKKSSQILVGFALETDNEVENATEKLIKKNMDLIVLNSLRDKGAGFGHDTNKVTLIDRNNIIDKFELKSKDEVARDILDKIVSMLK